jgi:large subunit ribosomal protein L29
MTPEDRESRLKELRGDLMHERGVAAMGGAPKNPGKIQAIRRNISRVLTIIREEERMKGIGVRKGGK